MTPVRAKKQKHKKFVEHSKQNSQCMIMVEDLDADDMEKTIRVKKRPESN